MNDLVKNRFKQNLQVFLKYTLDKMAKINFISIPVVENEYIDNIFMSFRKVDGIIYLMIQSLTITKTIPAESKILFGLVKQSEELKIMDTKFILFSDDSYCKSINATLENSPDISLYIESRDQPIEPGIYKSNGYVTLLTNPIII